MGAIEGSPPPSEAAMYAIGKAFMNPAGGPGTLAPGFDLEQRNAGRSFRNRWSCGRFQIRKSNGRRAGAIIYIDQLWDKTITEQQAKDIAVAIRILFLTDERCEIIDSHGRMTINMEVYFDAFNI
jgi:hypothetical protein